MQWRGGRGGVGVGGRRVFWARAFIVFYTAFGVFLVFEEKDLTRTYNRQGSPHFEVFSPKDLPGNHRRTSMDTVQSVRIQCLTSLHLTPTSTSSYV